MGQTIKMPVAETFDFTLFGIVTTEPVYRLSWLLNQTLKTELKEDKPVQIYHPKKKIIQEFERFSNRGECMIDLIQNKGLNGLLTEEYKQVDFWLKWEPELKASEDVLIKIKRIQNISLAFEVKPGSLKSKDRFIFTFEEES